MYPYTWKDGLYTEIIYQNFFIQPLRKNGTEIERYYLNFTLDTKPFQRKTQN